jgi:hypothetical protein
MNWMRDCQDNHPMCKNTSKQWLPSRLVDVRGVPKLIETRRLFEGDIAPYIALSHRWGTNPTQIFKLKSTNKAHLMRALPLDMLPPVFCDAIEFTQRAGFRYLWIDSVCIIQDSEEDWKTEAAQMSKVYAFCALNIAADHPGQSHTGLFYTRSLASCGHLAAYRTKVERSEVYEDYCLTSMRNLLLLGDGTRELRRRAWVMQEQVMSPRTLTFSDQLFWECMEESRTETNHHGHDWALLGRFSLKDWRTRVERGDQDFVQWYWMLGRYINCQMTFRSDILVALGAIAEEFATWMKTTYCAGLWQEAMPSCLIWTSAPISSPPMFATRQDTYRAPTWSWASLDFDNALTSLDYGQEYSPLVKILAVNIKSPFDQIYTNITGAELVLQGCIEPVQLPSLGEQLLAQEEKYVDIRSEGYMLDTGPESVEGGNLYFLPVGFNYLNRGEDIYIEALLLKSLQRRVGTLQTFERLGMATVVCSRCPPELSWSFDLIHEGTSVEDMPHEIMIV